MTAQMLVGLFEEMVDLKIRQHCEGNGKLPPQLKRLVMDQREADQRRLVAVRAELIQILESDP